MNIEVDFNQYLPSIATIAQYHLIFLAKGFIANLEFVPQPDQSIRLHVVRKVKSILGDEE
jgi:hypothetical protein